jgi:hypothetical protein
MLTEGCLSISEPVNVSLYDFVGETFISSATFDMENCDALSDSAEFVYDEFTAVYDNDPNCTTISIIGDNFYRVNPDPNAHSCTPGIEDETAAICVGANPSCNYEPDSDKSIVVDFTIIPAENKVNKLSAITFYEKAPDRFDWIEGPSGVNNFPTLFGIRLKKGSQVIYEESDITTDFFWNQRMFNFIGQEFVITEPTDFTLELIAYCPIGNIGDISAWDIDELTIVNECTEELNGGTLTGGPYAICIDGLPDFIDDISLDNAAGNFSKFVLVDSLNIVQGIYENLDEFSSTNLEDLSVGIFNLYHLVAAEPIIGCEIGNTFKVDFEGCFQLSNPITIDQFFCGTRIKLYPNPSQNLVNIEINSTIKDHTLLIFNNLGQIIYKEKISSKTKEVSLDLSNYSSGIYQVTVISGENMASKPLMVIK